KLRRPRIAPNTAPERTYAIPRARRAGGYMSPAAVRIRSATPPEAPTRTKPAMTGTACSVAVPSAVRTQPMEPSAKPVRMIGTRPKRSIAHPAGNDDSAEAVRKIAGPSPRSFSDPVTLPEVLDEA